jgi:hypothetical protein
VWAATLKPVSTLHRLNEMHNAEACHGRVRLRPFYAGASFLPFKQNSLTSKLPSPLIPKELTRALGFVNSTYPLPMLGDR